MSEVRRGPVEYQKAATDPEDDTIFAEDALAVHLDQVERCPPYHANFAAYRIDK